MYVHMSTNNHTVLCTLNTYLYLSRSVSRVEELMEWAVAQRPSDTEWGGLPGAGHRGLDNIPTHTTNSQLLSYHAWNYLEIDARGSKNDNRLKLNVAVVGLATILCIFFSGGGGGLEGDKLEKESLGEGWCSYPPLITDTQTPPKLCTCLSIIPGVLNTKMWWSKRILKITTLQSLPL